MKISTLSKYAVAVAVSLIAAATLQAADDGVDRSPEINGTVRGKYEYQTQIEAG